MTEKEISDKIGAMHLRFKDDEKNYAKLFNLLEEYHQLSDHYGLAVKAALEDGLKNYERYMDLEREISPRSIIIEKKSYSETKKIKKSDAEGYYRVVFILDDGSREVVHFGRKQSHLLYILILLCQMKNGLLADIFQKEGQEATPTQETIIKLVRMLYPQMEDKAAKDLVTDLSPDRSFSDSLQKMKSPLLYSLRKTYLPDERYWYMPYATNLRRKQLYRMNMLRSNIIYPAEFQPIINDLPDAAELLRKEGIEIPQPENFLDNDFAHWQAAAKRDEPNGLYYMGVYYGTGDVVSHNYQKSYSYFEKAAEKGHLDAVFQMGVYCMFGFGVKKDIYKALDFFEQAAKRGHAEAAAWAGQIYDRGTYGVNVDYKKSFDLYMIAAQQNHEEAMWYVIQDYLQGNGVKKDFGKATEWFEKAYALGYTTIGVLYGIHLVNEGNEKFYKKARRLFLEGCDTVPIANFMMAKMVIRGYAQTDNPGKEINEWLLKGAELGDDHCINVLRDERPFIYEVFRVKWEKPLSMLSLFRKLVMKMDHYEQEFFIRMVDAYRERWHSHYLREICKQLSIHKPTNDGGGSTPRRKITVRKVKKGNLPYELVLTLINGEEVIINKINPNSMVLLILTIICSYKSGYNTMMAKDDSCKPLLMELARLVNGKRIINLENYVDEYMYYEKDEAKKKNEDYYTQYFNTAKSVIKKSINTHDDATLFLFNNHRVTGRKIIKRMQLDPQNIELPPELMDLAKRMPDAEDVMHLVDNQQDKNTPKE